MTGHRFSGGETFVSAEPPVEAHKPIGLLNVADFYAPLLALMRRAVDEGFIPEARAQPFACEASPAALLAQLQKAGQPLAPDKPVLRPEQT